MSIEQTTIIDIPEQFKLRFKDVNGREKLFYLFPNTRFVCSICQYEQGMGIKEDKMKIIEYHSPDCTYYE